MAEAWLKKSKGWLSRYNRQKRKHSDDLSDKKSDYGVTFSSIKCPQCGSKKVKCYSTRPKIRYYYCKECQHRFKAIEDDN